MAEQKQDAKAAESKADESKAQQPITVTIVQPDRNAEGARAMEEGRALEMDKTVSGGRYLRGDQLVDANGEPIKESDTDKP